MRLLNAHTRKFEEFFEKNAPLYAILSHTWGDEEVSFHEFYRPEAVKKAGYQKIEHFCQYVVGYTGLTYVWIDTCCLDKTSSAELSEAINSMFQWYERSAVCFAYLADVPGDPEAASSAAFANSRWFKRGWTLQELLAPPHVIVLGSDWTVIGDRNSLTQSISAITGIGVRYLTTREAEIRQRLYRESGEPYFDDYYGNDERLRRINQATVAEKMGWAATRETSRKEDIAYCLLGLCAVNMPLLYGEGAAAFQRLQEAIIRQKFDPTLLAWNVITYDALGTKVLKPQRSSSSSRWRSVGSTLLGLEDPWSHENGKKHRRLNFLCPQILANRPLCFSGCDQYVSFEATLEWDLTSRGLSIKLPTSKDRSPYMLLPCHKKDDPWSILAVPLIGFGDGFFDRADAPVEFVDRRKWHMWPWRSLSLSTYAPAYTRARDQYFNTLRFHVASELQFLDVAAPRYVFWQADGLGIQWSDDRGQQRLLQLLVKSRKTGEAYIVDVEAAIVEFRLSGLGRLRFDHSIRDARQTDRLSPVDWENTRPGNIPQGRNAAPSLLITISLVPSLIGAEYLLRISEPDIRHGTDTNSAQETNVVFRKYDGAILTLREIRAGAFQKIAFLTDVFETHVPRTVQGLLSNLLSMAFESFMSIIYTCNYGLLSPHNFQGQIWSWFLCTSTYKLMAWAGIVLLTTYRAVPVLCYMFPYASHEIARRRIWFAALCTLPLFSDVVMLPNADSGVALFFVGAMLSFLLGPTSHIGTPYYILLLAIFVGSFSVPFLARLLVVPDISAGAMAASVGLVRLWLEFTGARERKWFTIMWWYTSAFVLLPPMYTEVADCRLNPFAMLLEDWIRRYQLSLYGERLYGGQE